MIELVEKTEPSSLAGGEPPRGDQEQSKHLSLMGLLRRGFALHPVLMFTGLLILATLAATIPGLIVDHRMITGAPAWLKPTKFGISLSIYCFTFVWLLSFLKRWKRTVRVIAAITGLGALSEMALITLQVVRGVASHFNYATSFDAHVYSAMGAIVVLVWSAGFVAAILLLVARLDNPVLGWALRLALFISLAGMLVAVLMTQPTALQRAAVAAGEKLSIFGAHSVGVPDGGPGLPIVDWSTTGGDLRIPHFVGLHALQILPLLGWLLSAPRFRRLRTRHRIALVWTLGLGYFGALGLLTWQALRGQSLIAPDGLTWLAWGILGSLMLASVASITIHARRSAYFTT